MKYRKQTQHIRRYRSGRWTCINKGLNYKKRWTQKQVQINLIAYNLFGRTIPDLSEEEKQAVENIYKKRCKRCFGSLEVKEIGQMTNEINKEVGRIFAKKNYYFNKQSRLGTEIQTLKAKLAGPLSANERNKIENILIKKRREIRDAWDKVAWYNNQLSSTYRRRWV